MITGVFLVALLLTAAGWIATPSMMRRANTEPDKSTTRYLLVTTILMSIFTVVWAIYYGELPPSYNH